MSLLVAIGVSYDADPDQVEALLIEEATKAAATVPGLLSDPAPFVRFIPGFGDSSLNFEVVYYVLDPDYNLYMDIQQQINFALFKRFEEEHIDFAFPTRTLHVASVPAPAPRHAGLQAAGEPLGKEGADKSK